MNRFTVLIFTLLFSSTIYGVSLEECFNQGREHMNAQGNTFINPDCENLTLNETHVLTRFKADDNTVEGHGLGNLIYLYRRDFSVEPSTEERHIITGEQSNLEAVHTIKLDTQNKVLTVLANSPAVIFNFRFKGGNVASIRTLDNDELSTATNIFLLNQENQLGVIHGEDNKISFYNRFADHNGRSEEHKTEILSELSGQYTELNQPVDAIVINSKLYVYNLGNHKVLEYDLPAIGDQSPLKTYDMSGQLAGKTVYKLEYNETSNTILIYDEQSLAGSLNLSP